MKALLDVKDVSVHFGGVHALDNVSFRVLEGEFLSLIGPNGAGKTTLLRAITGVVSPLCTHIRLADRDISRIPTHRRAQLGLALTHQIVRPFRCMTLLDNVALAAGHRRIRNIFRAMWSINRSAERQKARGFLALVDIDAHADDQPITGQPLGVLKRLEVARALAIEPRLLLLDEPLAGLNHVEAARLADTIARINGDGLTVVMIEHNLGEVLRVSQRLVVLDNGRKIAEGVPADVMHMPNVRAAYVGKGEKHAAA
jgi:branched-chain amino acid transport system ATP-binding protein